MVVLDLLEQRFQHHVLLLQLTHLPLIYLFPQLQLCDSPPHLLHLFHSVSLLLLV